MARIGLALLLVIASPMLAEDSAPKRAAHAVRKEIHRYVEDAKSMAAAPLHWSSSQWARFGEGTAAVAAIYAADPHLYDAVQRNRSAATNSFARAITPFGGRRAEYLSALLIIGGAASHDDAMRDAGRDSLEAEIIAGGIVTPLLKRGFGRARPNQEEGARSFHPFSSGHESFPSGHATNAFALATGIAAHYDNWAVPAIIYTVAGGVAMSRVNDRAHFVSDVVAGSLIGRALAKGIAAHRERGRSAWTLTPSIVDGRPALFVHLQVPLRP
ncbi:MAG TPA: phosphatase PAP2 family protein [Thermoanaerobaculia bacterium]|nr:phosphatase PAP2 family protein [Thermoanaerobaculia bacterium]